MIAEVTWVMDWGDVNFPPTDTKRGVLALLLNVAAAERRREPAVPRGSRRARATWASIGRVLETVSGEGVEWFIPKAPARGDPEQDR